MTRCCVAGAPPSDDDVMGRAGYMAANVMASKDREGNFFCTHSHARTGMHVRARESEGMACVVVVSSTRFESFF